MPLPYNSTKEFKKLGFSERDIPADSQPKLPAKISRVSNKDLGNLMVEYGAWREFSEHQLTLASAKASMLRDEYQYEWDKAYQRCGSGTETAKKRQLGSDQALAKLRRKVLSAEIFRDMISGRAESYTNAITVLSREITRRGFTIEQHA